MEAHNREPLLILVAATLFLAILSLGYLDLFPAQSNINQPVIETQAKQSSADTNAMPEADSLQPLLNDHDTISSTYTGLAPFYQQLQHVDSDNTYIHIAYFGDSMIEGDLITQTLRRSMQHRFGGNGPGFIPVTTPLPGFRNTIRQNFNNEWKVFSFVHPSNSEGASPGISGYGYVATTGAFAAFEKPAGHPPFRHAEILFGGKNEVLLDVKTDTTIHHLSLKPSAPVCSVPVICDTAFSLLEMEVKSAQPGILYGINLENGPGIYVDNYPFRGNSGLPLGSIPSVVYSGFNALLHNRLLIVHYGLNVFTPGVDDYHWYEVALEKVISHLKMSSPGIPILVVSMPDRSALIAGEYFTPASLPGFISMQKRVAARQKVAFFNLYNAMGGANSMKKWVEGHPKLAGDDYTHPNGAGASKIASLLFEYLMNGYDKFLKRPDSTSQAQVFSAKL